MIVLVLKALCLYLLLGVAIGWLAFVEEQSIHDDSESFLSFQIFIGLFAVLVWPIVVTHISSIIEAYYEEKK